MAPCYTIVRGALGTNTIPRAEVPNHCGFGVVEAVGAMVKRVQVGDRVVVAGTSQCGQCYQCLQGRPDYCQFTFFSNSPGVEPFPPFAELRDGTPVYAQAGIGGMSEIMTAFEEYCVPVFTDLPAAELTLLGDQLASGFAAGHARHALPARLGCRGLRLWSRRSWRDPGGPGDRGGPGHCDRSDQVSVETLR